MAEMLTFNDGRGVTTMPISDALALFIWKAGKRNGLSVSDIPQLPDADLRVLIDEAKEDLASALLESPSIVNRPKS